jgi:hypothetical protein
MVALTTDQLPVIPGVSVRVIHEIVARAVHADGRICEQDAAQLTIGELCELEALISQLLDK